MFDKDLVLVVVKENGNLMIDGRWRLPNPGGVMGEGKPGTVDPMKFNDVSASLGNAIACAIAWGARSVSVDGVDVSRVKPIRTQSPGMAAFETWAQEQVGDSGYRDSDNYWDELTADEQAMWERVAHAARRPLEPGCEVRLNKPSSTS